MSDAMVTYVVNTVVIMVLIYWIFVRDSNGDKE